MGTATTAYGHDNDLLVTCASPSTCTPLSGDALSLVRSPTSGLVEQLQQGDVTEAWTCNDYGELASQSSDHGGTPLVDLTYDSVVAPRDNLGRIREKVETRGGTTRTYGYTYDDQGRLTDVTLDSVLVEQYTYDDNGNRLTGYTQGEGTITGVYDDQDRLISYGDFSYTYTAIGELETKLDTVTGDQWDYAYDMFGNLLSAELPDERLVEYVTDGRHRRVGKKIDGVIVRQWVHEDQLNPVAELDGDGELLWQYVYASREHSPDFVVNATGDVYRVIFDQLGSPLLVVNIDNDTDVLLEAEYSAFGERTVIAGDGDALSLGFTGGEFDVYAGLTRFGAPDCDESVGRWQSKEPEGFDSSGVKLLPLRLGRSDHDHRCGRCRSMTSPTRP